VDENIERDKVKDTLKKKVKTQLKEELKKELKQELLEEIYQELMQEELNVKKAQSSSTQKEVKKANKIQKAELTEIPQKEKEYEVRISVKTVLKMSTHALKYANKNIPEEEWVEVIGLLAGKMENNILHIKNAYPMGHGNAIHVQMDEQRNKRTGHIKAYEESRKKNLFICGWYHSHPSYGCFMSDEDIHTQSEYQKHWKKAVAIVIDPYQIDGTSYGFEVFRCNLRTKKWYSLPFQLEESLNVSILPKLLNFINPIVDGKALFLEYDHN
jgi:proteasome lid subunit RPN8/RPN11